MDKHLSHFFQIHLCLARDTFLSEIGPRCDTWLVFWNEFLENDGGMMFMSWYGFMLADMTYHVDNFLLFLFSIANPSLVGRGN